MRVDTVARATGTQPSGNAAPPAHRPRLTVSEFLQLGLHRVAYLVRAVDATGTEEFVVHAADGMAIAALESEELAMELAEGLGLRLIGVH